VPVGVAAVAFVAWNGQLSWGPVLESKCAKRQLKNGLINTMMRKITRKKKEGEGGKRGGGERKS
jgi:hypothetical protein